MGLLLITVIGTVVGTFLAIEAKAWMPYLSGKLVRFTLNRMPDELPDQSRSRWEEEIEGDLASYADRPLGGLVFAVNIARKGGRRLAAELVLQQALGNEHEDTRNIKLIAAPIEGGGQEITYESSDGRRARRMIEPGDDLVDPGVLAELLQGGSVKTVRLEVTILRNKED